MVPFGAGLHPRSRTSVSRGAVRTGRCSRSAGGAPHIIGDVDEERATLDHSTADGDDIEVVAASGNRRSAWEMRPTAFMTTSSFTRAFMWLVQTNGVVGLVGLDTLCLQKEASCPFTFLATSCPRIAIGAAARANDLGRSLLRRTESIFDLRTLFRFFPGAEDDKVRS
jgi:hypothetical protein